MVRYYRDRYRIYFEGCVQIESFSFQKREKKTQMITMIKMSFTMFWVYSAYMCLVGGACPGFSRHIHNTIVHSQPMLFMIKDKSKRKAYTSFKLITPKQNLVYYIVD